MRYKGRIWKAGTSKVVTVPSKLDFKVGEEVYVTIEGVNIDGSESGDN